MADLSHLQWLSQYISSRKRASSLHNLFAQPMYDSCFLVFLGPESWCKIEIWIEIKNGKQLQTQSNQKIVLKRSENTQ
jgi:hypothetical protein